MILGQDPQVGRWVAIGSTGIDRVDVLDCLKVSFERDTRPTHHLVVLGDGLGRYALATRATTIGAAQVDFPEVVTEAAPLDRLHQFRWTFAARLERRVGVSGEPFGAIHLSEGYVAARTDPVCVATWPRSVSCAAGPHRLAA